jgi:hypothetical protein
MSFTYTLFKFYKILANINSDLATNDTYYSLIDWICKSNFIKLFHKHLFWCPLTVAKVEDVERVKIFISGKTIVL